MCILRGGEKSSFNLLVRIHHNRRGRGTRKEKMANYNGEYLPSGEAATSLGGEVGHFPSIRQQRLRAM